MTETQNNGVMRIQQIIAQAADDQNSTKVEKDIPLELDVGNLAVVDVNSIDDDKLRSTKARDDILISIGRDGIQSLINSVFKLERTKIDNISYAKLPPPTTRLPREKPVPKPKPLTKWEQYAKEKGIKKRKKETKVWDEVAQDFVPRYGKLKVQLDKEKSWAVEVPRQSDPYEDQFLKAAAAKKERIAKNEYQRLRNIARNSKNATPGVGVMRADTRDAVQLKKAMHFSRMATASIGKFQPTLRNEKPIAGFSKNTKQGSDKPIIGTMAQEKGKALKIIDRIQKPHVNTESHVIKEIEKKMVMQESADKRQVGKTGRRSKMGGRRVKKSGAALASLTDGKMGDKKSKKMYRSNKISAESSSEGKKKGGAAPSAGKGSRKGKSAFGGTMGRRASVGSKGKGKRR